MESLDSILKGNPEPTNIVERPEPKAETEVKAETPKPEETPEQKAERERDEKGRFKAKEQAAQTPAKPDAQKAPEPPKVEKPAPTAEQKATPATTPEAAPHVPVKALQEERRKRQELERQLAALQQQPKAPDLATDPAGFQQHLNSTLQAREIDMRVNLSAAWAKRQYHDFDAVMEKWDGLLAENPHLYQQAVQQDLPADWAYQEVKRRELLSEIGADPNAWREQQRAALRAELEAEFAAKQSQPPRQAAPVPPPSLANAPSSAGGVSTKTTQWEGPTPFQKALNRR